MSSVTFDTNRWQLFCQLLTTDSYRTLDELLSAYLARLIDLWPARGGTLFYMTPAGAPLLHEQGALSAEGRELIAQARGGFARGMETLQDLGVYSAGENELVVELPLRSADQVVGLLHLLVPEHEDDGLGRSDDLALMLVSSLGRNADHISLLQHTQEELRDINVIYRVSKAFASNLDLRSLLSTIIDQVREALASEGGSLLLVDEARRELYFELPTGERHDELKSYRMPIDQGIAGWVVANGQPAIVNDCQNDPRWYRRVDQDIAFETRSMISVPLRSRDRIIGVLQVVNKRSALYDDHDLRLMTMIAGQAAIAIENAQLYASLKEERDRIIRKEAEVRHQLNRDLHDGPAQAVAAIAMNIEFIKKLLKAMPEKVDEELDVLTALVKKTNADIRTLLFELRPLGLETVGLVPTFQQYVERFRDPRGLRLHLDATGFDHRLPSEAEATIFIIVQEAVNNARKHAGTQDIWITLREEQSKLVASVHDKGKGFDLQATEGNYEQRGSFGLLNMRERARLIGGECAIASAPGQGTRVEVTVPLSTVSPLAPVSQAAGAA